VTLVFTVYIGQQTLNYHAILALAAQMKTKIFNKDKNKTTAVSNEV
jgi:hypothetical protein